MELFGSALDLIVHMDKHLLAVVQNYGAWVYALLFAIIFCETGFVVTPFLPGDSLLFVAGTIAAAGTTDNPTLNVHLLVVLLIVAAILGDSLNYAIGRFLAPRLFRGEHARLLKPKYLAQTHRFFDRYGGRTIIIARFVPIVRTYAPFVAGLGAMGYRRFLAFNVAGAILWVALVTYAGYTFGNVAIIKNNLTIVIMSIIVLSLIPAVVEIAREKFGKQRA